MDPHRDSADILGRGITGVLAGSDSCCTWASKKLTQKVTNNRKISYENDSGCSLL